VLLFPKRNKQYESFGLMEDPDAIFLNFFDEQMGGGAIKT
jgi:hypothetical protein